MKEFKVTIEDNNVFVYEEESKVQIKSYETEKEAEILVTRLFNQLEKSINATVAGVEIEKTNIKDVQEMLKNEPNSKEKSILNWALNTLNGKMKEQ